MKALMALPMKSRGRLKTRQRKKKSSNLHFPSQTQNLFNLIISPQWLKFRWGNLILMNSTILKMKKSTTGEQQRQLTKPKAPKERQSMFWPWLFMKTLARYYLLNWGRFSTRSRPISDARKAEIKVNRMLKGLISTKTNLNTVSIGQQIATKFIGELMLLMILIITGHNQKKTQKIEIPHPLLALPSPAGTPSIARKGVFI